MSQDNAYEKNMKVNIIVTEEDACLCGYSEKSITPIFLVTHRGNQIHRQTLGMRKGYSYNYFQLIACHFLNMYINFPPCCG